MIAPLATIALLATAFASGARAEAVHGAFVHGVASGDPTHDSVVIWTRVTPTGRDPGETDPDPNVSFDVRWRVATTPPTSAAVDPDARPVVEGSRVPMAPGSTVFGWSDSSKVARAGIATARAERDWTVKVDVTGLSHGVRYWYAFDVVDTRGGSKTKPSDFPPMTRERRSETGTFELPPPKGVAYPRDHGPVRAAVFSCANWGWGYFHAYDAAARGWGGVDELNSIAEDSRRLHVWFHLGDYYYEYGQTHYPNADESVPERWRSLDPSTETVTLDDYRRRHRLYRSDPGLQRLHASAPVVAMWDDHEIANNPWMNGAEDHQAWEGDFKTRARAAIRAYHEWLPTREPGAGSNGEDDSSDSDSYYYNRTVHFGDVASFHVLETRLTARTDPNANPSGNVWANLTAEIAASDTKAPASWPGSALERRIRDVKTGLDAYRSEENEQMAGPAQLAWLADEVTSSAASGVAWQIVAQASPVMDMMSPDVEKAADALDGDGAPPPTGHESWRAALEAWTDWTGTAPPNAESFGDGGRAVPVSAARALLAAGRYRLNWNFDDWHGYAAERRRLLKALVPNANRAVIIGGDSHDSWAGVIAADETHWGAEGSWAAGARDPSSLVNSVGAVEFDAPSVSPPGAFEQSFAWCPSELIDRGHLEANPGTLRHAQTGRRGFVMITADADTFTADFVLTPTVRSRGYSPTCGGSFVVTERADGLNGGGLVLTERACPQFPSKLFTGPADPRFVDWSAGAAAGLGSAAATDGRDDGRIKTMDETWIFGVFLGAFFVVGFAAGLTWRQGACGDVNARGGSGGGDRGTTGRGRRGQRNYHSLDDSAARDAADGDDRQSEIEMGSVGGTRPSR